MRYLIRNRVARLALGALVVLAMTDIPVRAKTEAPIHLQSHRVVYDLKYVKNRPGSTVVDVQGRIVYELIGSSCEGYTINMRILTDLGLKDGTGSVTDTVMRNWEEYDGSRFVFETVSRNNDKLTENARGVAIRQADGKRIVNLSLPKPKTGHMLPANTVFPSEHLKMLIKAGRQGKARLDKKLFDGADDGLTPYDTNAFIGKTRPAEAKPGETLKGDRDQLKKLSSWPVTLSYYKKDMPGEGVPEYEVVFRLYENGISDELIFDYGDFVMSGTLKTFELLKETPCK
ncbi:MAG: hypothetical protein C0605_10310 [Hyphomicrobiales bacterium]|nr:MAG: hypothetical protein C0605_10310 [Hyphomicrobiales bacterium]